MSKSIMKYMYETQWDDAKKDISAELNDIETRKLQSMSPEQALDRYAVPLAIAAAPVLGVGAYGAYKAARATAIGTGHVIKGTAKGIGSLSKAAYNKITGNKKNV